MRQWTTILPDDFNLRCKLGQIKYLPSQVTNVYLTQPNDSNDHCQNNWYMYMDYAKSRDNCIIVSNWRMRWALNNDHTWNIDAWHLKLKHAHQMSFIHVGYLNPRSLTTQTMMCSIHMVTWSDACKQSIKQLMLEHTAGQSRTAFPLWSHQGSSLCATSGTVLTTGRVYVSFEVLRVTTQTFSSGHKWICSIRARGHWLGAIPLPLHLPWC